MTAASRPDESTLLAMASLCSGIGGLDLAVEEFFDVRLEWCSEIDVAASVVLAKRFGVPNVGDFRDITPKAVDVLCAGFPCQPVSGAGKRAGVNDERWLFDDICALVGRMDPPPRMLVFENVAGLLTANGGDAMGRVVHGLAALGYLGCWRSVRASDIGAPHRRERVFIVATHAAFAGSETRLGRLKPASTLVGRRASPDSVCGGFAPERGGGGGGASGSWQSGRPTDSSSAAAAATGEGLERRAGPGVQRRSDGPPGGRWGAFAAAVGRWERILGRNAPDPVDARGRLNPPFVEWMMGYDKGWVCDIIERRADALRLLGNAVVPQQAKHALAAVVASTGEGGASS